MGKCTKTDLRLDSELRGTFPRRFLATGVALMLSLAVFPPPIWSAETIVTNQDRNLRIWMQDALVDGKVTRLLYHTAPDIEQRHAGEKCTANFYVLELHPGLAQTQPKLLAENYCSYFGMSGTLLANGDVLIVAGDRVETWRPDIGKIKAWKFSAVDSLQGRWPTINEGNTLIDAAHDGNVVMAKGLPQQRNDTKTASSVVVGLSADGAARWQLQLEEPGVLLGVMDIWAMADGGALLHTTARPVSGAKLPGTQAPAGANITNQNRLYRISSSGKLSAPIILARALMPDFAKPAPMPDLSKDPVGFQAALQAALQGQQALSNLEDISRIAAQPRADGSVDALVLRSSNDTARKGTFLYRIGRDGHVLQETSLNAAITGEGLPNWVDFSSNNDQVILFGTLSTRGNRLPQGYLSWIDIATEGVVTRLVPLSELGLDAAKKSGDEQRQYLEHNPSQDAQFLTSLAGRPLTVSLIYRSRRPAIQIDEGIDEGPEQLAIYTEARDERLARAAKEERRKQRKVDREKHSQQLNAELASAIGVSPEEFAAMSNKERKGAMVRRGDLNAMMAAAAKQSQMAQQQMAEASGQQATPEDMNTQMAAAMAKAREAMAAAGISMPNMPSPSTTTSPPIATHGVATSTASPPTTQKAENILAVDASMRGYVVYEHLGGLPITLVIFNRNDGTQLLRKDYEDGTIYEYIDFSRFKLPLGQIGIVYRDSNNHVLRDLTPAVTN